MLFTQNSTHTHGYASGTRVTFLRGRRASRLFNGDQSSRLCAPHQAEELQQLARLLLGARALKGSGVSNWERAPTHSRWYIIPGERNGSRDRVNAQRGIWPWTEKLKSSAKTSRNTLTKIAKPAQKTEKIKSIDSTILAFQRIFCTNKFHQKSTKVWLTLQKSCE